MSGKNQKLYVKRYYLKHRKEIATSMRLYRKKNEKKLRAYYREWYKKNGRKRKSYITKWAVENKIKLHIYKKVWYAVKTGKIIKPTNCSRCSFIGYIIAHHEDYSKPLVVVWLCSSCHKIIHAQKNT